MRSDISSLPLPGSGGLVVPTTRHASPASKSIFLPSAGDRHPRGSLDEDLGFALLERELVQSQTPRALGPLANEDGSLLARGRQDVARDRHRQRDDPGARRDRSRSAPRPGRPRPSSSSSPSSSFLPFLPFLPFSPASSSASPALSVRSLLVALGHEGGLLIGSKHDQISAVGRVRPQAAGVGPAAAESEIGAGQEVEMLAAAIPGRGPRRPPWDR